MRAAQSDGNASGKPGKRGCVTIAGPHIAMAAVGTILGGLNVVLKWAFAESHTTEVGSVIFGLYRGSGAFIIVLLAQLIIRRKVCVVRVF